MARQRTWKVTCFETRVYRVEIEVTAKNAQQAEARALEGDGTEIEAVHKDTSERDPYAVQREAA